MTSRRCANQRKTANWRTSARADTVEKVENPTTPKISQMLILQLHRRDLA
jgi:hypothetical protein